MTTRYEPRILTKKKGLAGRHLDLDITARAICARARHP